MKIETIVKSHADKHVKYANGVAVQYDHFGIAEVSDEDGAFLVEKYAGQIFEAGRVVQPAAQNVPVANPNTGAVSELKEQLAQANRLIVDNKAAAVAARDGERVWREKCEELIQKIQALEKQLQAKAAVVAGGAEEKATAKEQQTVEQTLEQQLMTKTVKELISIAQQMQLPTHEYQKLTRLKLVNYIISKTNNA